MMVSKKIDLWKLLVYLVLFNNPSQGIGVPTEFLEAFIGAHNRHSTLVIAEKNSGTERRYILALLIFYRIFKPADFCYAFEKWKQATASIGSYHLPAPPMVNQLFAVCSLQTHFYPQAKLWGLVHWNSQHCSSSFCADRRVFGFAASCSFLQFQHLAFLGPGEEVACNKDLFPNLQPSQRLQTSR